MMTSSPEKQATKKISLQSLLTHQVALCTLPVLILVLVASLDNADKQLLASSFPLLERTLNLSVDTLGYFSLFTNLSYALSLPLWGWLVHRYGMQHIHTVLSMACLSWGAATIGIALSGESIVGQAIFRALNGVALGSILPLSQTLLVGMVTPSMRGRAFGYMGLCEKLAGTLASASVIYFEDWQRSYYVLGFLSVVMSAVARKELTPGKRAQAKASKASDSTSKANDSDTEMEDDEDDTNDNPQTKLTVRQILHRIARIPAFICLVAQGIFGGTPWDMMSFMLLLLDWRQFSKEQIVAIQFSTGITSTIGGWMGGMLGDYAASRRGTHGRIAVALASVLGGIPLYGMFLYSTNYYHAIFYINIFHVVASWPPAGALRPICADLARNPSERAQIVSLWIVLEKTSGAVFGAPLVGYLTSNMVKMKDEASATNLEEMTMKAGALAWNLFGLSSLFWTLCAIFWVGMAYTIDGTTTSKDMQLAMYRKDSNIPRRDEASTPLI
jgi:MFS family permease